MVNNGLTHTLLAMATFLYIQALVGGVYWDHRNRRQTMRIVDNTFDINAALLEVGISPICPADRARLQKWDQANWKRGRNRPGCAVLDKSFEVGNEIDGDIRGATIVL